MIPWTESAAQHWDDYCRRTRENLRGSGADADEVVDDLRRHVEEEARTAQLTVVSEEDLRRILARVGEPAAAEAAQPRNKKSFLGRVFLITAFVFGVVLPTGTILFELFTGASAAILFDPLPTWFPD